MKTIFDAAYYELVNSKFEIDTENSIYQMKLGQFVELERIMRLVGFEPEF
jgi:hypothetical protein